MMCNVAKVLEANVRCYMPRRYCINSTFSLHDAGAGAGAAAAACMSECAIILLLRLSDTDFLPSFREKRNDLNATSTWWLQISAVSIVIASVWEEEEEEEETLAAATTSACNTKASGAAHTEEKKKKKIMCLLSITLPVSIVTITDGGSGSGSDGGGGCWWWIKRSERWPRGHLFSFKSPSVAAHPLQPLRHCCRAALLLQDDYYYYIRPAHVYNSRNVIHPACRIASHRVVSCRAAPCQPLLLIYSRHNSYRPAVKMLSDSSIHPSIHPSLSRRCAHCRNMQTLSLCCAVLCQALLGISRESLPPFLLFESKNNSRSKKLKSISLRRSKSQRIGSGGKKNQTTRPF